MSWRDLGAGEVRTEHVGRRHTLAGWAARRRDHGGLIFVDLRDETGVCQLVVNPERAADAARTAHEIRNEYVLRAAGIRADADFAGRSVKGQFTQASRLGARITVVVDADGARIRPRGGEERTVPLEEVPDHL